MSGTFSCCRAAGQCHAVDRRDARLAGDPDHHAAGRDACRQTQFATGRLRAATGHRARGHLLGGRDVLERRTRGLDRAADALVSRRWRRWKNPPLVKVVPDKRAPYERVAQVLAAAQRSGVQALSVAGPIADTKCHARSPLRTHRRFGNPAEQQDAERKPDPEVAARLSFSACRAGLSGRFASRWSAGSRMKFRARHS